MVAVSTLGLALSTFTFYYLWSNQSLELIQDNIKTVTGVMASTVTPNLVASKPKPAAAALQRLVESGQVVGVSVYHADGTLFAQAGEAVPYKMGGQDMEVQTDSADAHCIEPCKVKGEIVGYVAAIFALDAYHQQRRDFAKAGLAVNACCFFLVLLASFRFQSWLTRPILRLAGLAGAISKDNDFSRRAKTDREDELGSLYTSFNQLLEQVEEREGRLRRKTQVLQLMESVSRSANVARNPDQALKLGMDSLCAYTGWPLAHAWKMYPEGSGS
jgi:uncharacterized membrane protein affecting hemolysin expression